MIAVYFLTAEPTAAKEIEYLDWDVPPPEVMERLGGRELSRRSLFRVVGSCSVTRSRSGGR